MGRDGKTRGQDEWNGQVLSVEATAENLNCPPGDRGHDGMGVCFSRLGWDSLCGAGETREYNLTNLCLEHSG